ncbi:DUF1842 domain-containing protein [Caulobacter segnis]
MTAEVGTLHTQKTASDAIGLWPTDQGGGGKPRPARRADRQSGPVSVQAASGHVAGIAEIYSSGAIPGGNHRFTMFPARSTRRALAPNHQLVSLRGRFVYNAPPPAIGFFPRRTTSPPP